MKVIVSAGKRGTAVLYGEIAEAPVAGRPVTIRNARMILRWPAECGGLLGLAARGPVPGTAITAAVPSTTPSCWTDWTEVSSEAAEAIDAWGAA